MAQPEFIDARGPRFSASITTVVLIVALLTKSSWLLAWQLFAFGFAAFISLPQSPYGTIYRKLVQPRLAQPAPSESSKPPRFAQIVGFGFVLIALVGSLTKIWWLFDVATAACIFAAFLNAAFNFCLGCKIYLLGVRAFR